MANPAVVGTPTGHASTGNGTSTGAVGGTFTAGNALFAQVAWTYSGTGVSGQINVPAGWTDAGPGNVNDGAPNGVTRWYYLLNNAGGAQTWTWTVSALSGSPSFEAWSVLIVEVSGAPTSGSPFDLTVKSNNTGASAATPIDTGAATGTTASTTLLLQMAAVARSTITISGSNAGSVPTSGWTVSAKTSSSGSTVNSHAVCQFQGLTTTVASPRGEITPNTSCSWMTALLTIKAAGNTTTDKTQTGKARIQATTTQTQTGVANIRNTTTRTITGVAKIGSNVTTTRTQTGKARIQVLVNRTQTGVARVQVTDTKTITGKANIVVQSVKTQTGKARITATTTRTITGVANISGGVVPPAPAPVSKSDTNDGGKRGKRPPVPFVSAQREMAVQPVRVTRVPEWLLDAFLRGDIDEEEFTVLLALE